MTASDNATVETLEEGRTGRRATVQYPPDILDQIDALADKQHRSRSSVLIEAAEEYLERRSPRKEAGSSVEDLCRDLAEHPEVVVEFFTHYADRKKQRGG